MLELVGTAIVTVGSLVLLSYWFRYSCLLILAARATPQDYTREFTTPKQLRLDDLRSMLRERTVVDIDHLCAIAVAHDLSFPEVQSLLRERAITDLDRLRQSLDRDWAVVIQLAGLAGERMGREAWRRRTLALYYRLLGMSYHVRRQFSVQGARSILEEMSWVVAYFAEAIGEPGAA